MTQLNLFTISQHDLVADYAPAQRHSETSVAAAEAIRPVLNELQARVLSWLRIHGPATDEEMQRGLAMNPSTQRPRRVELVGRGLVVAGGVRKVSSGRMATAWRVV